MDLNSVGLHPEFPEKVWVVVEQPRDEPIRLAYDPVSQTFTPTAYKSLTHARGFSGVYGWIGGTGIPPGVHFDVLLLTRQAPQPGEVLLGYVCGVFLRRDDDHKFVAMDAGYRSTVAAADLSALDEASREELERLYPEVGEGEGWFGAQVARSYLRTKKPVHD
jgi:inorganic pyrophosphatase